MTKAIKVFMLILLIATSWSVMGCSSDDDNDNGKESSSSIVGTWRYTYELSEYNTNGYVLTTLNPNGTGVTYTKEGIYDYTASFTYTYSNSTKELIFFYEDGEMDTYTVLTISSTMLQVMDEYGDVIVYNRVK